LPPRGRAPTEPRIYIVEGIPGSGKDTIAGSLNEGFAHELCYTYSEEAVLCGWQHYWLRDVDEIRMQLAESLLDYVETTLHEAPNARFVFNRFHLSINVLSHPFRPTGRYVRLIERLANLPMKLMLPVLQRDEVEQRCAHVERKSLAWRRHLRLRIEASPFDSIADVYWAQQNEFVALAEAQGLPFELIPAGDIDALKVSGQPHTNRVA